MRPENFRGRPLKTRATGERELVDATFVEEEGTIFPDLQRRRKFERAVQEAKAGSRTFPTKD